MENLEKEVTVPKWVQIVRPKIPQLLQNISANAQKFEIFEKNTSLRVVQTDGTSYQPPYYVFYLRVQNKNFFIVSFLLRELFGWHFGRNDDLINSF